MISSFITLLAQTAASDGMLNRNEFNPVLLGQLIQILLLLGALGFGVKAWRRNPPVGEDIIKINGRLDLVDVKVTNLENKITDINTRLRDGDGKLTEGATDIATLEATLDALKADMHTLKTQMGTVLANTSHGRKHS